MAEGLAMGAAGTVSGLALAAVAGQAFRGILFGVPPIDGPTFLATAVVVVATMAMACYLPARRVSRLAAAITLRSE
jgi:ABC-type antimicrobial peptide transport system permease subunit